jgi:hypothetical protein
VSAARQDDQDRELREVPIDERALARFRAELPNIIEYRERRVVPAHRSWGWEAIGYGAITAAGLLWWDWSPWLVLLHLMLMQWIGLLAEVLVLRRLQRRGVGRLLSAGHVNEFVEAVIRAYETRDLPWRRGRPPSIQERWLPYGDVPAGDNDKVSPGALAATLVFFGLVATAIMAVALWYAGGSLRQELAAQPEALLLLGAASVVRLFTLFRLRIAPPLPGASWNVEFTPGLRLFGLFVLAMLSPAVFQARAEVEKGALGFAVLVGAWGVVTLLSLPSFRRTTGRMRKYLEQPLAP